MNRTRQPGGPSTEEILGWDVRTWSSALELWRESLGTPDRALECLELGAGPGGPSLWLAAQGHNVVCSNMSDTVSLAKPLHGRFPSVTTIEYRDLDMTKLPWESHFDVVVFKSVVGGVHPLGREGQQLAIDQILSVLKPGGKLFFAENSRGSLLHRAARALAFRRRSGSWRYPTRSQMESYFSGFSSLAFRATGFAALFGLSEKQRDFLARADERVRGSTSCTGLAPSSRLRRGYLRSASVRTP